MADRMFELASKQRGFLGVESARDADGFGITVSYWSNEEAIAAWKAHADHQPAQEAGKRLWYEDYQVRIAKGGKSVWQDTLGPIAHSNPSPCSN